MTESNSYSKLKPIASNICVVNGGNDDGTTIKMLNTLNLEKKPTYKQVLEGKKWDISGTSVEDTLKINQKEFTSTVGDAVQLVGLEARTPPEHQMGKKRKDANNEKKTLLVKKDYTRIRISNLPETMTEHDVYDLTRCFGPSVKRIVLNEDIDRETGDFYTIAFVTFSQREIANRAIKALHGYGYDHLILHAELYEPDYE